MSLLALALAVFFLLGVTFGWLAWFRVRELERRLGSLHEELRALQGRPPTQIAAARAAGEPGAEPARAAASPPFGKPEPAAVDAPYSQPEEDVSAPAGARIALPRATPVLGEAARPAAIDDTRSIDQLPPPASSGSTWWLLLREHWMILLGGACVGLAGVFLVRHSIEQGLLGPLGRVLSGLALGLLLHAGAELLRRRHGAHPALAGLAAGGSLTLFAALLAALHLYQLLSPALAFLALATVALATLLLALRHGPLLAVLGLLAAYAVPLLVASGQGSAALALAYALLVSAAALLLLSQVRRHWLWWGALAGGLAWWGLTFSAPQVDGLRGPYLAMLGYLLLALPWFDFGLRRRSELSWPRLRSARTAAPELDLLVPAGLALLILAQVLGLAEHYFGAADALLPLALLNSLPLALLLLWVGPRRRCVLPLVWALPLAQIGAWLLSRLSWYDGLALQPWPAALLPAFFWYCLICALSFSALALYGYRRLRPAGALLALAVLAPPLYLALAWLLSGPASASLQWPLLALLLGALGLALAGWRLARGAPALEAAWLSLASHAGYSLAMAFQFREAGLSLALALQILSLAWLLRRFQLPVLGVVLKVVVTLVLLRLSLNPWLFDYSPQGGWALWTYGGATLCCALAAGLLGGEPRLRAWTQGAALHLFTLFVWLSLRWWLYGGDAFAARFDFLEACLTMNLAAALAFVYRWRAGLAGLLGRLYRAYARLLLALALLSYATMLGAVLAAAPWALDAIDERRVFNLLPLAFAGPALFGLLAVLLGPPRWRRRAALFSALAGFVFVSLEIRHLWTGGIDLYLPYSNAELYSYSAVWLLLALAAVLGGAWRLGADCSRAGMALLALVLIKLFLVDMAGLEGLLRVASFLGMGLGLLAIAYLHQRLRQTSS